MFLCSCVQLFITILSSTHIITHIGRFFLVLLLLSEYCTHIQRMWSEKYFSDKAKYWSMWCLALTYPYMAEFRNIAGNVSTFLRDPFFPPIPIHVLYLWCYRRRRCCVWILSLAVFMHVMICDMYSFMSLFRWYSILSHNIVEEHFVSIAWEMVRKITNFKIPFPVS